MWCWVAVVRTDFRSVLQLLVTANVGPSSLIFTLMMEALSSSETEFLQEPHGTTSQKTAFFINLKSYIVIFMCFFSIFLWLPPVTIGYSPRHFMPQYPSTMFSPYSETRSFVQTKNGHNYCKRFIKFAFLDRIYVKNNTIKE
jgi:hypothetical protein